jgi:hypothetical protein
MCITPLTIVRKYNTINGQTTAVVPCGKCVECLQRRSNGWAFRLDRELKFSVSSAFLTLTYESVPLTKNNLPTLNKKDFQLFMKRLRKKLGSKIKLKYYAVGEYGSRTLRPHYHAIMFNLPQIYLKDSSLLHKIWGLGHIHIGDVNIASIKYVTNYITKGNDYRLPDYIDYSTGEVLEDDRLREFSLMSKKLGISYLSPQMVKFHKENLIGCVTLPGGVLQGLPRYFKDKLFTREEKATIVNEYKTILNLKPDPYIENPALEIDFIKSKINISKKLLKQKRIKV